MTAEGRACVDIVVQIAAVQAALKNAADMIVADHVHEWLKESSRRDGRDKPEVEELLKVFNQYYR